MKSASRPTAPIARRAPVTQTHHDHARTDDYAWLRAENWQEVMRDTNALPADIRSYLEAENAYFADQMADTEALQEQLFQEMRGRIKEDDSTVPLPDGPWAYATRYVEGGQHPLYVRERPGGGEQQILVDGNAMGEGCAYFRIGGTAHSPDHRLFAWAHDDAGSEFYTISVRDIETGRDLPGVAAETTGTIVWAQDCRHLFYVRLDANHRPSRVFRHAVGTSQEDDVLVYEESDSGFFVTLAKTQSDRFIVIHTHDHETSEEWIIPADQPGTAPKLIAARETAVEYSLDEAHGIFYILTNTAGGRDFRIVTAPVASPGRDKWIDLVPHEQGRLILAHLTFARHLVRLEREDGLARIIVRRLADGAEHVIAFDEEAYSLGLSGSYEFDADTLRFTYSSMATPLRVYDYDMETRERVLRKEQEVPSGHDPSRYVTRRIEARAPDGEAIPISLLYRRDLPLDGSAPALLYGYGAYGIAIPASFSITRLSLVDRGFIYAIAHIRGGKEKGYSWYEAGKRQHKANTFSDFIAAAEHLIAQRFTSRGKIVAEGGSAGGMLMGAVANMSTDLFAGIIAAVPFVDVLNTMLDETLPLTPPEWPEWGNPVERAEDYRTVLSYSPYENVAAKPYPPILVLAGLTDPRVTYWEPAKWVARLRALKTDDHLLLLRTNMDAGHAGAAGRFDALKEKAVELAFALKVTGGEAVAIGGAS